MAKKATTEGKTEIVDAKIINAKVAFSPDATDKLNGKETPAVDPEPVKKPRKTRAARKSKIEAEAEAKKLIVAEMSNDLKPFFSSIGSMLDRREPGLGFNDEEIGALSLSSAKVAAKYIGSDSLKYGEEIGLGLLVFGLAVPRIAAMIEIGRQKKEVESSKHVFLTEDKNEKNETTI